MQEKILQCQQSQLIKHKKYLMAAVTDYRFTFFTILLPAFIWGWRSDKKLWMGKIIKDLIEVGMFAALTHFKKHIKSIFIK